MPWCCKPKNGGAVYSKTIELKQIFCFRKKCDGEDKSVWNQWFSKDCRNAMAEAKNRQSLPVSRQIDHVAHIVELDDGHDRPLSDIRTDYGASTPHRVSRQSLLTPPGQDTALPEGPFDMNMNMDMGMGMHSPSQLPQGGKGLNVDPLRHSQTTAIGLENWEDLGNGDFGIPTGGNSGDLRRSASQFHRSQSKSSLPLDFAATPEIHGRTPLKGAPLPFFPTPPLTPSASPRNSVSSQALVPGHRASLTRNSQATPPPTPLAITAPSSRLAITAPPRTSHLAIMPPPLSSS